VKPPKLKYPKKMMSFTISLPLKELLEKASKATGLSQGEYVECALVTQFKKDHVK
jgi:hypothetical protein